MDAQTAKRLTGTSTDSELAAYFGVSRQAVHNWQRLGQIPRRRQLEVLLQLNKKRPAIKTGPTIGGTNNAG